MMRVPSSSRGFGLVEILVAMFIGMITVLVIMQVMAGTEAQRRTVVSGSDSGTAAALAMQEIQRDLMNAGYGLLRDPNLFTTCGANPVLAYNATRTVPAITIPAGGFVPVAINPPGMAAADANTDIVQVIYAGSDFFAGRGIQVTDGAGGQLNTVTTQGFVTSGLQAGDLALILQGTSCILSQLTAVPAANQITRAAGTWNQSGDWNRGLSFTSGSPGALYSLGSPDRFVMKAFAVRSGRLTVCSPVFQDCATAAQWLPVAEGVVSLRAEIGVDTNGDDAVDTWAKAVPVVAPALTWEDVKAIRIALVTRGQQRERDPIANADCTPSWAGDNNDDPSPSLGCPSGAPSDRRIVLNSANTPDAAAWAQYRHRVSQTTIPLRNAFWSNN